jgi:hypothetical protein
VTETTVTRVKNVENRRKNVVAVVNEHEAFEVVGFGVGAQDFLRD